MWTLICLIIAIIFILLALLFIILKDKSVFLISGFNELKNKELYDTQRLIKDMLKQFITYIFILLLGSIFSYLINDIFGISAFIIFIILFFKEIKLDNAKAFRKYLLK